MRFVGGEPRLPEHDESARPGKERGMHACVRCGIETPWKDITIGLFWNTAAQVSPVWGGEMLPCLSARSAGYLMRESMVKNAPTPFFMAYFHVVQVLVWFLRAFALVPSFEKPNKRKTPRLEGNGTQCDIIDEKSPTRNAHVGETDVALLSSPCGLCVQERWPVVSFNDTCYLSLRSINESLDAEPSIATFQHARTFPSTTYSQETQKKKEKRKRYAIESLIDTDGTTSSFIRTTTFRKTVTTPFELEATTRTDRQQ